MILFNGSDKWQVKRFPKKKQNLMGSKGNVMYHKISDNSCVTKSFIGERDNVTKEFCTHLKEDFVTFVFLNGHTSFI